MQCGHRLTQAADAFLWMLKADVADCTLSSADTWTERSTNRDANNEEGTPTWTAATLYCWMNPPFFIESAHSMTTSVACVSWCWKVDQRFGGNCASDVLLLLQRATLLQLLQSPIQEKLRIAQDIVATFVHECRSDLRRGWHGELVSKDTASHMFETTRPGDTEETVNDALAVAQQGEQRAPRGVR